MTAMVRPNRDWPLRKNGLGLVSTVHLITLPSVAQQIVPAGQTVFIDNLWAPLLSAYPQQTPPVARIRENTQGTATIVRLYEELEGVVNIHFRCQIQKISAGSGVIITITTVTGVALDENPADPSAGIANVIPLPTVATNQNSFLTAEFNNDALVKPFPGDEGGRRYIDAGVQISIATEETIQLIDSYARLKVLFTQ